MPERENVESTGEGGGTGTHGNKPDRRTQLLRDTFFNDILAGTPRIRPRRIRLTQGGTPDESGEHNPTEGTDVAGSTRLTQVQKDRLSAFVQSVTGNQPTYIGDLFHQGPKEPESGRPSGQEPSGQSSSKGPVRRGGQ